MTEKWSFEGDWFTTCNCDYGCPCNFNARPSPGFCQGVIALKIGKGRYGKLNLAGAKAVGAAWWPGAIHEGHGIAQWAIDGNGDQVAALERILSGEAGGMPYSILPKTFDKVLPTKRLKIDMKAKGKDSFAHAGDFVNVEAEAIRNPITGAEFQGGMSLKTFLIFPKADFYSNKVHQARGDHEKLVFDHKGRHFSVAKVKHKGP
jgi:hypothetical protein